MYRIHLMILADDNLRDADLAYSCSGRSQPVDSLLLMSMLFVPSTVLEVLATVDTSLVYRYILHPC